MSQTERILYLNRMMQKNGKVTVKQAADHYEVSTRQVKRDIEYLRDRFNAPIVYDRGIKAYRYEEKFDKLIFADQQIIMFYVAMKSLTESGHYIPIYTDEMINNFQKNVPKDYKDICEKISYQVPRTDTINSDFFIDICDGMRDKKCLAINYINVKGEESERLIEPEKLINYDGSWYIAAFDKKNNSLRTFNVSRLKKLSLTKHNFENHGDDYKQQIDSYISDTFGIFKGNIKGEATIRFIDTAKEIIKTQSWHPKQKLDLYDNYTELTLPVADYTEILSRILAFGCKAKPIAPKELVDLWKKEIQTLSEMAKD